VNQKLKTTIEFTKNLFVTGAFTETSRKVELEICRCIPKDKDVIVVEFGMGHGNITKEILNTISPNSKLYAFEVKEEFCDHVRTSIQDDRLVIINDGAENMKNHVNQKIDSVIASIPFSFFSKEKGMGIIQDAYDSLSNEAYYSQVLYTKFNFKKFKKIFDNCEIMKLPNFPTEYIYHCQKQLKQ
jgi:phospholipid N-methyltransferase